ncbi:hypothetical protein ANN_04331 [Periplaneta americana]|uniref:Uncharacterized protein n=1 Tax=Periplaneta americana TaxID=6978 RepID=A0ABQ8TAN9_PERAM|nr:hypothetical protein ANN_04331 [Periplaneta americana]
MWRVGSTWAVTSGATRHTAGPIMSLTVSPARRGGLVCRECESEAVHADMESLRYIALPPHTTGSKFGGGPKSTLHQYKPKISKRNGNGGGGNDDDDDDDDDERGEIDLKVIALLLGCNSDILNSAVCYVKGTTAGRGSLATLGNNGLKGCEIWTLTLREEQSLRLFENKILRKIFGAKRDREWMKLHNVELHALYSSLDIIRNIKFRGMRWAEHLAGMGESRNACRVLVG